MTNAEAKAYVDKIHALARSSALDAADKRRWLLFLDLLEELKTRGNLVPADLELVTLVSEVL
jgi:hypothetical protein